MSGELDFVKPRHWKRKFELSKHRSELGKGRAFKGEKKIEIIVVGSRSELSSNGALFCVRFFQSKIGGDECDCVCYVQKKRERMRATTIIGSDPQRGGRRASLPWTGGDTDALSFPQVKGGTLEFIKEKNLSM